MAKKRSPRGKGKKHSSNKHRGKKRELKPKLKRARKGSTKKKGTGRHAAKHSQGQGKRVVKKDKARGKNARQREAPPPAPEKLSVVGANARVLSHVDKRGHTRMVDVSAKKVTSREATAEGYVVMEPATLALIQANGLPKGDVLAVARVAGIMAAKKTSDIIPMCHPLQITGVSVDLAPAWDDHLRITATVKVKGKTGVEMEALTAVSAAALTVYDMCKAVDRGMRVEGIRLLEKLGGRSGHWVAER